MPLSEDISRDSQRPAPPSSITAESMVAEHRALHATVGAIETALHLAANDPGWRARLLGHLGDLQRQLEGHFMAEEQSGLYEDLAEACPQHVGAALRLRREHDDLRRRLDKLIGEAGATPVGALRSVTGRVHGLLRDLEHHEARENELLLDMLDDGIGVGD